MTDFWMGVLLILTAYAVGVSCLLVFAWREWGQTQSDYDRMKSEYEFYLRAGSMSRHPAGSALPPEVEPHILAALNKAAENPGTVIYGTWPADPDDAS